MVNLPQGRHIFSRVAKATAKTTKKAEKMATKIAKKMVNFSDKTDNFASKIHYWVVSKETFSPSNYDLFDWK